jgi:hypothetical protein
MVEYYAKCGIKPIHFPIHDFNEVDLKMKIVQGADVLNKMIN